MTGFESRLTNGVSGLAIISGKLHNQDAVLGRQGYQQHDADLGVNAHRFAHNPTTQHRPEDGYRQTHYGCHRACPTFILGSQNQVSHQQRHYEDDSRRTARLSFLISHRCPFVAELIAQLISDQTAHRFDGLSRALAWRHIGGDRSSLIHVISAHLVHAKDLFHLHEAMERHHFALRVFHTQFQHIVDVFLRIFAGS